jgi:hypothetical protein
VVAAPGVEYCEVAAAGGLDVFVDAALERVKTRGCGVLGVSCELAVGTLGDTSAAADGMLLVAADTESAVEDGERADLDVFGVDAADDVVDEDADATNAGFTRPRSTNSCFSISVAGDNKR